VANIPTGDRSAAFKLDSTIETSRSWKTHEAIAVALLALGLVLGFPAAAMAQSGHFVGTPTCSDEGTTVECTGKVAGLGGTTFTITVSAPGTASVTCTNPAGNVAPGQSFSTTATGTSGPFATPRNGSARFTVESDTPSAPPGSCPNPKWTATVTDVEFGDATITLTEDGTVSDAITVPVS
jgi:hypothetical protein